MAPVYIKRKLLEVIMRRLVFHNLADLEPLPQGNGRTVRFNRYERVGLPFERLVEGITPTDLRDLVVTAIEASIDQWGDVMSFSDQSELTVMHKSVQIGIERMGTAAAELVDREIQKTLEGSGTLVLPDPAFTTRAQLTENDFVNASVVRRVVAAMRDAGTPDFDGWFIGVINPFIEMDLQKDNTYATTATHFPRDMKLFGGRIRNEWLGVRWMISNHIPFVILDATNLDEGGTDVATHLTPNDTPNTLAANQDITITALDNFGFERWFGSNATPAAFIANDIIRITLTGPTLATRFNIYAGPVAGAQTLQAEAVKAGVFDLTSTGSSSTAANTAIKLTTTGAARPVLPPAGVQVHKSYIFGREAFGNIELTGIQTTMTGRIATDTDPLKQRVKIGYKLLQKPVVKTGAFYRRIESASDHD